MTKEQVIAMAQICGDWNGETVEMNDVGIKKFATLVRNAALEECADSLEHGYVDDEGHHIQYANELRKLKEPTT